MSIGDAVREYPAAEYVAELREQITVAVARSSHPAVARSGTALSGWLETIHPPDGPARILATDPTLIGGDVQPAWCGEPLAPDATPDAIYAAVAAVAEQLHQLEEALESAAPAETAKAAQDRSQMMGRVLWSSGKRADYRESADQAPGTEAHAAWLDQQFAKFDAELAPALALAKLRGLTAGSEAVLQRAAWMDGCALGDVADHLASLMGPLPFPDDLYALIEAIDRNGDHRGATQLLSRQLEKYAATLVRATIDIAPHIHPASSRPSGESTGWQTRLRQLAAQRSGETWQLEQAMHASLFVESQPLLGHVTDLLDGLRPGALPERPAPTARADLMALNIPQRARVRTAEAALLDPELGRLLMCTVHRAVVATTDPAECEILLHASAALAEWLGNEPRMFSLTAMGQGPTVTCHPVGAPPELERLRTVDADAQSLALAELAAMVHAATAHVTDRIADRSRGPQWLDEYVNGLGAVRFALDGVPFRPAPYIRADSPKEVLEGCFVERVASSVDPKLTEVLASLQQQGAEFVARHAGLRTVVRTLRQAQTVAIDREIRALASYVDGVLDLFDTADPDADPAQPAHDAVAGVGYRRQLRAVARDAIDTLEPHFAGLLAAAEQQPEAWRHPTVLAVATMPILVPSCMPR